MKYRSAIMGALCLDLSLSTAADVAGHVYDKLGNSLSGANVCLLGSAACVQTGGDGSFHLAGVTRTLPKGKSGLDIPFIFPRQLNGLAVFKVPASNSAKIEWFTSSGRKFGETNQSVDEDSRMMAASKVSATAGIIEVSKVGYTNVTYYPATDPESNAYISLPNAGDSILFDGKSLAGWDAKAGYWSVKSGSISGASNTANKFEGTFLVSKGSFGDFRLTVTEKIASGNNHLGLCIWGNPVPAGDGGAGKCLVVIPPDGSMWDYGNGAIHGAKVGNSGADAHAWHQVELLERHKTGEILAAVNGVQITYYKDANPARLPAGPVRLQLHAYTGAQEALYRDIVVEANPKEDRLLSLK